MLGTTCLTLVCCIQLSLFFLFLFSSPLLSSSLFFFSLSPCFLSLQSSVPALSQCLEGLHSAISPRSLTPTFSELRKVGAETRSISFSSCLITLEDGSVDSHIVDDGTSTCINEMTLSDEWEERVLDYVKYCHECWVYERVSLCVCV